MNLCRVQRASKLINFVRPVLNAAKLRSIIEASG